MPGEGQAVEPAIDPTGQAWMNGDVSTADWFAHVRAEAAASAARDAERARAFGSPAVAAEVEG